MTIYEVTITEVVTFTYTVEASGVEQAEQAAEDKHLATVEGSGSYDDMQVTDRHVDDARVIA